MYRTYLCLGCHDRDGRGGVVRMAMPDIPDFTDPTWHSKHPDDAELRKAIVEGKGKLMPALKEKLDDEDLGKLVAFIRSFKGTDKDAPKVVVKDEPKEPPQPPPDVPVPPPPLKEPGPAADARVGPDPRRQRGVPAILRELPRAGRQGDVPESRDAEDPGLHRPGLAGFASHPGMRARHPQRQGTDAGVR